MKIQIGEYEVNISAKYRRNNRANKADTMSFLNELAIAYFEAAQHNNRLTCYAIGKEFKEKSDYITDVLRKNGLYDDK